MPIFKFNGVNQERINLYAEKINEISKLIVADPKNIMFICENTIVLPNNGKDTPIFITIEWMARPDKEQLIVDHLKDFFKDDSNAVGVFITEMNGKWYMKGNKIG
ncbi:DUF1904 family protein [Mesoplasma photuris]|uniref:DUF1904 family protein n=1 Tax=Mesoplasma photuris TaxID=217731 RepID=UPI0004E25C27|nr:DUF1904 family protein [Mesoplasma photuris]